MADFYICLDLYHHEAAPMPPASGRSPPTKDFLTLWEDAEPDIPILKEAKAEYAKLQ
jgi:hypothetical protein